MGKRLFVSFLVVLLTFGIVFLWWQDATSAVDPDDTVSVIFVVPKGQSIRKIASNLKEAGLIKDQVAFFTYVRFSSLGPSIQAGNFRLTKSMDVSTIAKELTHGTIDVWVTIIEGWRAEEIAFTLSQNLGIPEGEFLRYSQEGYLFPDTYLIPKEATAAAVINLIIDNFNRRVEKSIIEKGKKQGLNLHQIIILASIIEREVRNSEDRSIITGILLKRLREGWPLQADATIQYALGYQADEKTWWKKNLTIEDLQIDSPFNTYKYTGLPPGPISNPGLSAISAVVSPKTTDFWYYLSDKEGKTHYAQTRKEHEENIEKYLR